MCQDVKKRLKDKAKRRACIGLLFAIISGLVLVASTHGASFAKPQTFSNVFFAAFVAIISLEVLVFSVIPGLTNLVIYIRLRVDEAVEVRDSLPRRREEN